MNCEVFACDRRVFAGDVRALYTRTPVGWLGVLPRHAPAVFALEDAPLRLDIGEGRRLFRVRRGVVHVTPEGVSVWADEVREENGE